MIQINKSIKKCRFLITNMNYVSISMGIERYRDLHNLSENEVRFIHFCFIIIEHIESTVATSKVLSSHRMTDGASC